MGVQTGNVCGSIEVERGVMEEERTECIKCGECCRKASPTLHLSDVRMIESGLMPLKDLYTIRIGEPVYDNLNGRIGPSPTEMIKIRERPGDEGCVFLHFDDKVATCLIYEERPCQCRAMKCWDDSEFKEIYAQPRASRWDMVRDEKTLLLMDEHESRCGYEMVKELLRAIGEKGESAVQNLLELIRFDYHIRPFTNQRLGVPFAEMEFYFGRPLSGTIEAFGLQLTRRMDGSFFLTTLKQG